jgi:hypothetical protein
MRNLDLLDEFIENEIKGRDWQENYLNSKMII